MVTLDDLADPDELHAVIQDAIREFAAIQSTLLAAHVTRAINEHFIVLCKERSDDLSV